MGRLVEKDLGGIRIIGFSVAGEEAVVAAPEYNVCFDVGRAPREVISIDNICITHGHMDHAAGLAYYFSQRTFIGIAPGRVVVHRGLAQSIQRLMDTWADIEGHPSPGEILGVEALQDIAVRRGLLVRPFAVNHSIYSLGYTLIEVRHKLKEEFHGRSGPELVALKRQGIQIDEQTEVPLLTYAGDTALGRWLDLDFVRNSQTMITECTFFDREHLPRARAGRHIHVDDLPRILEAVPGARIMLAHLTRRTDLRQARRILEGMLGADDLARVSFMMERSSRSSTRHSPGSQPLRANSRAADSSDELGRGLQGDFNP